MSRGKKWVSILLSVVLILGLFPISASADGSYDITNPSTYLSYPGSLVQRGSTGVYVQFLQDGLNNLYDYGLGVDGQFGAATDSAVRDFQSRNGLNVDGQAGSGTWGKLLELLQAKYGHVDIGDGFYAYIINVASWKSIENSSPNVQLAAGGNSGSDPRQIWYFSRQSDGSYKIVNQYDGTCLDDDHFGNADGSNVISHTDNGGSNQRWFMSYQANGVVLRPACSDKVMDLSGGSAEPGTNVQLFTRNNTDAQIFSVYHLENDGVTYVKPAAPSASALSISALGAENEPTTFTWTVSPATSRYDTRTYDLRIWSGGAAYYTKLGLTATSFSLILPAGSYTAQLTATNGKYLNYYTSGNLISFTVSKKTYAVTYNANGGSGAPAAQTKTSGTGLTLSTAVPTRTGYNFLGWSTSSTASAAQYAAGGTYTADAAATLYAVWSRKQYAVTYDANGGTGAPSMQIKQYDIHLVLSSAIPTRTGYNFLGWSTSSSASAAEYAAGGAFNRNAPTTLYAVWSREQYAVTYSANGGTGAPSAQTKQYGINLTLSGAVPTRTGYNFLGWSTSSTASAAQYAAGGTYTADAAATLYAVWSRERYLVIYDANGGTGAPAAQTKQYGIDLTLSPTVPARSGYTFVGWTTNASSTSVEYRAGGTYTGNASAALYAVWRVVLPVPDFQSVTSSDGILLKWANTSNYDVLIFRRKASSASFEEIEVLNSADTCLDRTAEGGETYYYQLFTAAYFNGSRYESEASVLLGGSVLAAPAVEAVPSGSDSVRLSWNAVDGAAGYDVFRRNSATGGYTYLKTTASLDCTDAGLTSGTVGAYKVCAFRATGTVRETGYYGLASTAVLGPPVLRTSCSDAGIQLNWSAVEGTVTYNVYCATSQTGPYSYVASLAGTSWTDHTAKGGTMYYYKVRPFLRADGKVCFGADSNVGSCIILAAPTLNTLRSNAGIQLNWSAVEGTTTYNVYRATSKTGTYSYMASVAGTGWRDHTAQGGTTYYYKVRAYKRLDGKIYYSSSSNILSGRTAAAPALKAAPTKSGSVLLRWTAVDGALGYDVFRYNPATGGYTYLKTTASLNYTDAGLTAGTVGSYKVCAYWKNGTVRQNGYYGSSAAVALAAPTLTAVRGGSSGIALTWAATDGATAYNVYRSTSKTGTYTYVASVSGTAWTDKTAAPGVLYYYEVRAYKRQDGKIWYSQPSAALAGRANA